MMNDIIDKAKKLLALRDRAGTQGEAEAAARALSKLLDKHRITMAELETKQGRVESIVANEKYPLIAWERAVAWRRALIDTLSKHYGVAHWRARKHVGYTRSLGKRYRTTIHLCGRQSDIDLMRYMFAWLSCEIVRIAEVACAQHGRSFKRSWMFGFVEGLDAQLKASRQEVLKTVGETAMVLLTRLDEAERAMVEQVSGLKTISYTVRYNGPGHEAGQRRGLSHHLGDKLDCGNTRALPAKGTG